VWVIEGLEGGGVAVLPRVHHGAVDGTRGLELEAATLDLDPAAATRPGIATRPGGPVPGPLALLGGAALGLAVTPVRMARTATHLARATGRLAGVLVRGESTGLALPMTAPRTSLNRAVTTRRAFAFCSLPLAAVERATKQEGVTVNDVVLALTAGALRRYLADRGELPDRPLVAAMPVGLPLDGAAPNAGGNRWAVTTAGLATDIADPTERLRQIAISARAGKVVQHAIGPELWQDLVDLPPAMIGWIARAYAGLRLVDRHPPLVNVVVSNLRGSPLPLYFAGTQVEANYPIGPVADGLGLNVTVVSYRDALDVGLSVCPDLVEDPWLLVDALRAETDDLALRYPGG
jgi:WS/DGAT/MGAT family acyltransferase